MGLLCLSALPRQRCAEKETPLMKREWEAENGTRRETQPQPKIKVNIIGIELHCITCP